MSLKIIEKCLSPYINPKGEIYACGQCEACRRMRMREWSIRATHEFEAHNMRGTYVTLSYNFENLPKSGKTLPQVAGDACGTLRPKDMTDFIKRLRKWTTKKLGKSFRYMQCGEYGSEKWRPHHHIFIFGIEPAEFIFHEPINHTMADTRKLHRIKQDVKEKCEVFFKKIWGHGRCWVDVEQVHEHIGQYIVGYIRKKIGPKFGGKELYEENGRVRPYMTTSRGLGEAWGKANRDTWTQNLTLGYQGGQHAVPRYYIKRVFKEEGDTVKWKVPKKDNPDELETHYKVLKNIEGHYTKKILEAQSTRRFQDAMEYCDDLLGEGVAIVRSKIIEYIMKQQKVKDFYNLRSFLEYDEYKTDPVNLQKKLAWCTLQRRKWKFEKNEMNARVRLPSGKSYALSYSAAVDAEDMLKRRYSLSAFFNWAKQRAEIYNINLAERDVYGRRDKYEMNEYAWNEYEYQEKLSWKEKIYRQLDIADLYFIKSDKKLAVKEEYRWLREREKELQSLKCRRHGKKEEVKDLWKKENVIQSRKCMQEL